MSSERAQLSCQTQTLDNAHPGPARFVLTLQPRLLSLRWQQHQILFLLGSLMPGEKKPKSNCRFPGTLLFHTCSVAPEIGSAEGAEEF
ncbi:hypothetical protein D4764_22G0002470 [Takifugu flavidus]|uniref:Uncharacterized protein n=1 Tax=Takifugu flavidus TaxID=433684 RepID=A0A5C6NF28_9TELE|nr:hypothetical protein D4764_22G0002470 [Takifugu flavidus]